MREGGEKNGQQRSCQSNGYDSNVYCTRYRVAIKNSCGSFGSFFRKYSLKVSYILLVTLFLLF